MTIIPELVGKRFNKVDYLKDKIIFSNSDTGEIFRIEVPGEELEILCGELPKLLNNLIILCEYHSSGIDIVTISTPYHTCMIRWWYSQTKNRPHKHISLFFEQPMSPTLQWTLGKS